MEDKTKKIIAKEGLITIAGIFFYICFSAKYIHLNFRQSLEVFALFFFAYLLIRFIIWALKQLLPAEQKSSLKEIVKNMIGQYIKLGVLYALILCGSFSFFLIMTRVNAMEWKSYQIFWSFLLFSAILGTILWVLSAIFLKVRDRIEGKKGWVKRNLSAIKTEGQKRGLSFEEALRRFKNEAKTDPAFTEDEIRKIIEKHT